MAVYTACPSSGKKDVSVSFHPHNFLSVSIPTSFFQFPSAHLFCQFPSPHLSASFHPRTFSVSFHPHNFLSVSIPTTFCQFPSPHLYSQHPIQQCAVWAAYPVGMFCARGNTRAFSGSQPTVRRLYNM